MRRPSPIHLWEQPPTLWERLPILWERPPILWERPPGRDLLLIPCLLLTLATSTLAAESGIHQHHHHMADAGGVVMNENTDHLPRGCSAISEDVAYTITAGSRFASDAPGTIFGMSQHEVRVPPCSRVTVTLVNEDDVRHQWMVHGLPKYLYPAGMFHIEAMGGRSRTGTFIVPPDHRTYLIHCDMAQHMEKGMRGQLVVGRGSGDLWGVPGVSDAFYRRAYLPPGSGLAAALIFAGAFAATWWLRRRHEEQT